MRETSKLMLRKGQISLHYSEVEAVKNRSENPDNPIEMLGLPGSLL